MLGSQGIIDILKHSFPFNMDLLRYLIAFVNSENFIIHVYAAIYYLHYYRIECGLWVQFVLDLLRYLSMIVHSVNFIIHVYTAYTICIIIALNADYGFNFCSGWRYLLPPYHPIVLEAEIVKCFTALCIY